MGKKSKKKASATGKEKRSDGGGGGKEVDMFDSSNWLVQREKNAKYGNYFVAKEDIREGAVIGRDKSILRLFVDPSVCMECGSKLGNSKPVVCPHHEGKCKQIYCSTECQEWAWSHYHSVQDGARLGRLVEYCKTGLTNTRLSLLMTCKLIAFYKVNSFSKCSTALSALVSSALLTRNFLCATTADLNR